jgi:hypothetical protein
MAHADTQNGLQGIDWNEAVANPWMMLASEDHTAVRFGHAAPQCIIQKSLRNT